VEGKTSMRGTTLFAASLLVLSAVTAQAQPSQKMARLCFLTFDPGSAQSPPKRYAAFFDGLRDLGYVHGQTIDIDYLADGGRDRYPALAAECLQKTTDVIVVTTTPAAKAAKEATRTVPIVMTGLGDPVATGIVNNLARPEGNVTGMSNMAAALAAKRLALLKETAPAMSRVLVPTYLRDPIGALQVDALKAAAPALGLTLLFHDVRTSEDIPGAFEAGAKEGADGLFMITVSIFQVERAKLAELAARYRLPSIFSFPLSLQASDAQGLMAYHVDEPTMFRAAAGYVDRILKGARPSDLPVQQPSKFRLVINLKTAKALGLVVPPTVIARADEVVE
jgi:putative ABC transport system substrate-binding protein